MNQFLITIFALVLGVIPSGQTFLKQLQPRDSILIADQLEYGFEMEGVQEGTGFGFADFSQQGLMDSVELVRNWKIDTLKIQGNGKKQPRKLNLRASIVITTFEPGTFYLPPLYAQRQLPDGSIDTLQFEPQTMEVTQMPVDTTTYVLKDIKGQIRYPVTFKELIPYLGGLLLLAALVVLAVFLIRRFARKNGASAQQEPPYVMALRKLDQYRAESYWAPAKQKIFYSGITDALREYIEATFGVNAMEMTTAEIFDGLKGNANLTPELYTDAKELFELADFVKFAKHTVGNDENARALPTAVRFVTSTYQTNLEAEQASAAEKEVTD